MVNVRNEVTAGLSLESGHVLFVSDALDRLDQLTIHFGLDVEEGVSHARCSILRSRSKASSTNRRANDAMLRSSRRAMSRISATAVVGNRIGIETNIGRWRFFSCCSTWQLAQIH